MEGVKKGQAIAINESLSVFGRVIRALGDKQGHIPYRDSILTKLIKSTLEGNNSISLIINICSDLIHLAESKSSLEFGRQVKRVQKRNNTANDCSSVESKESIQSRIHLLKQQLLDLESKNQHEHVNESMTPSSTILYQNMAQYSALESQKHELVEKIKTQKVQNRGTSVDDTLQRQFDVLTSQLNALHDVIWRQKTIPGLWIPASSTYKSKSDQLKDAESLFKIHYG